MKNLIFILLKYGMRFIYFFMKLFTPVQNKAVFLSRQSDAPSENFLRIAEELQRRDPGIKCEFYCKRGLKSEMGLSYMLLMLRQMLALAGAKICITESYCIPISVLNHKKSLRIIQIWHSMVAIKKFGWQTVDMPEGSSSSVARIMQMHRGYDNIVVGSEYMRGFFSEAMNTPKEKILPLGMPIADRILDSDNADDLRAEFIQKYPQAEGRKIVLYLPTMRRDYAVDCAELVQNFDYEKFALVIKLHPLDSLTVISDSRAILDPDISTEDAILLSDAVISDYSGAAAEAALLDKPVYFFAPDVEKYGGECGLNFNPLEVFPNVSFADANELIAAICSDRAEKSDIMRVRELLCGGCDGHSTEHIVDLALR